MFLQRHKFEILFLMGLVLLSCKKEATLKSDSWPSNEFGVEGKAYSWESLLFTNGKPIEVNIPAGAVNYTSFVEMYQYSLNDHLAVDSFLINGFTADFYLLRSNVTALLQPAQMKLPFYFTLNFTMASGYTPYKVKAEDYSNLMDVLNNYSNWTPITNFTFDNTTKYLSFEITDLNAIYLIGKPK